MHADAPKVDDPYFVPAGHGSRHDIFPGVAIVTTAGSALMFSMVTLDAGSEVPEHSHPHEQLGIMISGQLEFTIGGVTRLLSVGDIWKIPGDVPHSVRATQGPAVALDVFHPIRDDYL